MLAGLLVAASVASAAADLPWETYVCTDGPTVRVALDDVRPATRGFVVTDTQQVIALSRHKGEADAVLRGGGYMVRPFNWTDILYAPPGRPGPAYQCRVAGAADRVAAPSNP